MTAPPMTRLKLRAVLCGSFLLTPAGASVPSRHPQAEMQGRGEVTPEGETPVCESLTAKSLSALEVGLAGPPVISADGSWWLLGRDGEVERFRADDHLIWSISIAARASICSGEAPSHTDRSAPPRLLPIWQPGIVGESDGELGRRVAV